MLIITYDNRTWDDAIAIAQRIVELRFVARVAYNNSGCFSTSVVVDDANANTLINDVNVATDATPTTVA